MSKKTLWEGANAYGIKKLEDEVPSQGKVLDKKRPKLEAFRKMSNAYYDHFNNGSINGRGEDLRAAAKSVGKKAPSIRELQDRHRRYERNGKYEYVQDMWHAEHVTKPAERELEQIARKVAAAALREHSKVHGQGHNMASHGEGKKYGDK